MAQDSLRRRPEPEDTLGWVYLQKGLATQAIAAFERALSRAPQNPMYHYHQGLAYLKSGKRLTEREHRRVSFERKDRFVMGTNLGFNVSLLLALPIALARWLPGAGLASSAMMLNSLATAVTASLLVLCARQWGYSSRTAITAALLFGAATFAWVYARTMFSEPLVALGWLAAVWLLLVTAGKAPSCLRA